MRRQKCIRRPSSPATDRTPTFQAMIENSSDIIARFDLGLRCRYINHSISRYFAPSPASCLGKTLAGQGWPPEWVTAIQQAVRKVRETHAPQQIELEHTSDASCRVFETQLLPEFNQRKQLSSFLCIAREITASSLARRLLLEENAVLEMIADNRPIKQVLHRICLMIESQLTDGMCSIMCLDAQGQTLLLAAAPSLPDRYSALLETLAIGPDAGACGSAAFWRRSIIVNDIAESPLWENVAEPAGHHGLRACWSTPVFSADHQLLGTLAIYYAKPRSPTAAELRLIYRSSHITAIALQRARHETQLHQLATRDGLTRLYNRRYFMELAQQKLQQTQSAHQPVSVLMLDLDHFKLINDHHGHAVGDRVLEHFGRLCLHGLRATDIIGRMGGEEFAALLPNIGQTEAAHIAERLRQQAEQCRLSHNGHAIHFQVSIGIATQHGGESLDTLLGRADRQLYWAKKTGRNRVCTETPHADQEKKPAEDLLLNLLSAPQMLQC